MGVAAMCVAAIALAACSGDDTAKCRPHLQLVTAIPHDASTLDCFVVLEHGGALARYAFRAPGQPPATAAWSACEATMGPSVHGCLRSADDTVAIQMVVNADIDVLRAYLHLDPADNYAYVRTVTCGATIVEHVSEHMCVVPL